MGWEMHVLRKSFLTCVSFLCWAIWKARCSFVYQHQPVSPTLTLRFGLSLAYEFLEANKLESLESNPTSLSRPIWTAPPPSFVKLNCDAAWKAPSEAGLGVIIRDHTGSFLGGSAVPAKCSSAAVAESEAVLSGVNLAISMDLKLVKFESDALEIISDLRNTSSSSNWRTYPIIQQIRRRCTFFDDCCWDWVPREANRAAHLAASLANRTVGPQRWANQPPPSLTRVLRNDGLPCPPANL
ncbi:uncharacterized protein LOC133730957 [Rosa rugosa]|uniref:uncharacterized protein LOC133730957 n=1 Tax=Rosa rugosa TaxID=74645 RepID=UPI002B4064B7|nr:uncharacterized protein LOC133730957 [Rosa rugosa]